MSDPVRLLASDDATDLERELLGSWKDEQPGTAARDKTLAMLGVAGGAATGAAAAGGSIAPKAVAASWAALAKWLTIGAFAVGATTAGVTAMVRHRAAAVAAPAPPAPVTPVATQPTTPLVAPPPVVDVPDSPPPTHRAQHVAAPAASSIVQQIAALDRARGALEQGDAARARKLVDAYETDYPGGALVQEAELLRIESLAHDGKSAEATHAGKRFLAAYPNSPHDARVRALMGSHE